jgi:hypothetical protein
MGSKNGCFGGSAGTPGISILPINLYKIAKGIKIDSLVFYESTYGV